MNACRILPICFGVFAVAIGAHAQNAAETDKPLYRVTMLQSPGNECRAYAINNNGYIVGHYGDFDDWSAAVWIDGKAIGLGECDDSQVYPLDINDHDVIAGVPPGAVRLNEKHEIAERIELDGTPTGINNSGDIIGFQKEDYRDKPVLWKDGKPTPLVRKEGEIAYRLDILPTAINDAGVIVGFGNQRHPSVLPRVIVDGMKFRLGMHRGYGCRANDVNAANQIVGGDLPDEEEVRGHGFLWDRGSMTDLGTIAGYNGEALAINDSGTIVGRLSAPGGRYADSRACLWTGGKSHDLNKFVPRESDWVLYEAVDINNRGEIVCVGDNASVFGRRAFLLTPVDGNGAKDE